VKRLVELSLRSDFSVDDELAGRILSELGRADLRRYLAALRRELRRTGVRVTVEGGDELAVADTLRERFPERNIEVRRAQGTGAGVTVAAGDDVLDASVAGYLRAVLQELKGT
jgi:hypothetical protein